MYEVILEELCSLRTELLNERIFFFGQTRYSDFFIQTNGSYALDASKLKGENFTTNHNSTETIGAIKNLLQEYHQSPFWKQCWWLLTRSIRFYQRITDIDSLSRLEESIRKSEMKQAEQIYGNSFKAPGWGSRLFNTWRVRLSRIMSSLTQLTALVQCNEKAQTVLKKIMLELNEKPTPANKDNPYLSEMSKELSKGSTCSLTSIVDNYENLKFCVTRIDADNLRKLEVKINLLLAPDKHPNRRMEAEAQFKRFAELKAREMSHPDIARNTKERDRIGKEVELVEHELDKYIEKQEEQMTKQRQNKMNKTREQQSEPVRRHVEIFVINEPIEDDTPSHSYYNN